MIFQSLQTKGRGRATKLGFPTVNLEIPDNFNLKKGVYGAVLIYNGIKYLGALHYGSSPAFKDEFVSLEIFLIDVKDILPDFKGKKLTVETKKYLRPVLNFDNLENLIKQIGHDVEEIRSLSR